MNTCSITVRDVRNAVLGRAMALRKYVAGNPRLHEEYLDDVAEKETDGIKALPGDLDAWIAKKGFKILKEHAFVTFENNIYYVDVMYTIEMDD